MQEKKEDIDMLFPDFKTFKEDFEKFDRIPVYREIVGDTFTPIALLRNFSSEENLFMLESANLDKTFSRYSFFGFKPKEVLTFKNKKLVSLKNGKKTEIDINPMDYLNENIKSYKGKCYENFGDFSGGYVGYIGYEMINYMGVLRQRIKEPNHENLMQLMLVDEFYLFDNYLGKMYSCVSVECKNNPEEAYEKANKITLKMAERLHGLNFDNFETDEHFEIEKEYESGEFVETVKKIKKDIYDGEVIQCVFSNKYEINSRINPLSLYRTLRNLNPSPYMFYLKFGQEVVCGSSPEIHLKVKDKVATLKPIAGTYPVGENLENIKKELLADEKERAEHLMLLDLARNDLYTCCKPETVKVDKSFVPEVYSHVIHIVSEVKGELKEDASNIELFMKTFPAGTVTGAPKVRAMELIDKYEKSPRGFYAGCTGYFSYSGNMDTCITIRSAKVTKDKTIFRAGAGIVHDSIPEKEFKEVEEKLKALFKALERIKSMERYNVFTN
jgi:anthranilate synthase component 1